MKVTVVIPTMNEEKAIARVIRRIPKNYDVLVVDKSTDRTPEIARKAGARVIKQKDKGKGKAMILGANKAKGDIIIFMDGDNTYDPKEIPKLVEIILQNKADVVVGARTFKIAKNISMKHFLGNLILSFIATLLYEKTSDLCSGMRAIKKKDFLDLKLRSTGFEIEAEFFAKAHKKGLKINEIKIKYNPRVGKPKLSSFVDGLKIINELFKNLF